MQRQAKPAVEAAARAQDELTACIQGLTWTAKAASGLDTLARRGLRVAVTDAAAPARARHLQAGPQAAGGGGTASLQRHGGRRAGCAAAQAAGQEPAAGGAGGPDGGGLHPRAVVLHRSTVGGGAVHLSLLI